MLELTEEDVVPPGELVDELDAITKYGIKATKFTRFIKAS